MPNGNNFVLDVFVFELFLLSTTYTLPSRIPYDAIHSQSELKRLLIPPDELSTVLLQESLCCSAGMENAPVLFKHSIHGGSLTLSHGEDHPGDSCYFR